MQDDRVDNSEYALFVKKPVEVFRLYIYSSSCDTTVLKVVTIDYKNEFGSCHPFADCHVRNWTSFELIEITC